jgi:thiamine biosynthesis lipoprotein
MKLIHFCFLLTILICQCKTPKKYEYTKLSGKAQGTTYHITYENTVERDLQPEIDSILKTFDLSLSVYIPNSIISRINANDSAVQVDSLFIEVFNISRTISENSDGAFDITVGPLVNAWGFGPKGRQKPTNSKVDSLLKYIGYENISIVGNKLLKKHPQTSIDVNAIAQGFSVDIVCQFLDRLGTKNYLVEIGGELKTKGRNSKGEFWRIGIDKPTEDNLPGDEIQQVIVLNNQAMATSGDYRKFYIENGVKYAHHIDPHTGYPAKQTILSVSVISSECAISDGYATSFMVSGLEKTKTILSKHKELEAYIIYSDEKGRFCEYMTEGVKKMILK